jgi:hypothetical protein
MRCEPTHGDAGCKMTNVDPGMTLRDYFAAKAMQGWMANPTATPVEAGIDKADPRAMADVAAVFAYMVADAMLAERETK